MDQERGGKYFELIERNREIQEKIAEVKRNEINEVLVDIVELMVVFDISPAEVNEIWANRIRASKGVKHIPKYIDPKTGSTWSGRGRRPRWLIGKNLTDFELSDSTVMG
ncbi:H-NS histone family protein [Burkholderia cepacia]|uniref:H-NS histone family protein n=1 Tax=Burkholderia cepacia TaxID=292 RepID=UPI0009BCD776|nr:H-NS histone family protein [Burkholderia cepacia]